MDHRRSSVDRLHQLASSADREDATGPPVSQLEVLALPAAGGRASKPPSQQLNLQEACRPTTRPNCGDLGLTDHLNQKIGCLHGVASSCARPQSFRTQIRISCTCRDVVPLRQRVHRLSRKPNSSATPRVLEDCRAVRSTCLVMASIHPEAQQAWSNPIRSIWSTPQGRTPERQSAMSESFTSIPAVRFAQIAAIPRGVANGSNRPDSALLHAHL